MEEQDTNKLHAITELLASFLLSVRRPTQVITVTKRIREEIVQYVSKLLWRGLLLCVRSMMYDLLEGRIAFRFSFVSARDPK